MNNEDDLTQGEQLDLLRQLHADLTLVAKLLVDAGDQSTMTERPVSLSPPAQLAACISKADEAARLVTEMLRQFPPSIASGTAPPR
jgi:hypothetical protein